MTRIYKVPFATGAASSDIEPLATNAQPDGKVSLETGWTNVYRLPKTNPSRKNVGLAETNGIWNEVTAAIGELQLQGGFIKWQSVGGGFNKGAVVYGADMQTLYQSTTDANTTDPDSVGASGWGKFIPEITIATSGDIAAGTAGKLVDAAGLVQYMSDGEAVIYPNGGSAGSPANITINRRYVITNPFPGSSVDCKLQAFISGTWGDVINNIGYAIVGGNGYNVGCVFGQLGDDIIIQTATNFLMLSASAQGNIFGTNDQKTTLAIRMIVEKSKKTF